MPRFIWRPGALALGLTSLLLTACANPSVNSTPGISTLPPVPAHAAAPELDLTSASPPTALESCVVLGLSRLQIPSSYIQRERYRDGALGVRLAQAGSDHSGPDIQLLPRDTCGRLLLYSNGMVLSPRWRALLKHCAAALH